MSLLLQALQKAAKSRDGDDAEPTAVSAVAAGELSLEPVAEPHFSDETASPGSATPAQAAAVLRANETQGYSMIDRVRDRPIIAFIAAAVLFAIGYGVYVYIQIANPGALGRTPPPAASILAAAPTTEAAASAPAKVTGMPSVEPIAAGPAAAGAAVTPQNDVAAAEPAPQVAAAAPKRQRKPPGKPSRPRPTRDPIVTSEAPAADDLEVVEIPASQPLAPAARGARADGISVRRAPASVLPVNPTLAAAYAALQKGDYAAAESAYQQVLAADPQSIDALLGLAAIDRKQGRIEQASRLYGRVLELDPRNSHARAGLIAMLGGAAPVAAESQLKQLIGREPSGFLYFTLGNLYAEQGQWPSAQQAYFQAFQLQTDNPDFAFNLAVGLEHLGQSKLALEHYRKALDLSFKKGHANFDQSLAIQRVGQLSAHVE